METQTNDYILKIRQTMSDVRDLLTKREEEIVTELQHKIQREKRYVSTRTKELTNQSTLIDGFQSDWSLLA